MPSHYSRNRRVLVAIFIVSSIVLPVVPGPVTILIPIIVSPVVFTAHIMTVNPFAMMRRPVARHPNHFPVIIPVRCAAIKRAISDLNTDPAGARGRRKQCAHEDDSCDQKSVFNHS
ncbi:MAG: hypothetical protein QOE34_1765 [Verrucomicrobiota bacterium]